MESSNNLLRILTPTCATYLSKIIVNWSQRIAYIPNVYCVHHAILVYTCMPLYTFLFGGTLHTLPTLLWQMY